MFLTRLYVMPYRATELLMIYGSFSSLEHEVLEIYTVMCFCEFTHL